MIKVAGNIKVHAECSRNFNKGQYPHEEKIEKKFEIFFNFFWSPGSRIVPKNVKRDLKKA